jgi:hypothetical protein
MAARTNKVRHDDETRARIKTSQLINRLHDHIFNGVEMSKSQVTAVNILLKKTLPDLTATELSGGLALSHEDALKELE